MSRPRLLAILTAALSLLFIVPATAGTLQDSTKLAEPVARTLEETIANAGISIAADDSVAEQRKTRQYWTSQRRSDAKPVDVSERANESPAGLLPELPTTQQSSQQGSATRWDSNGGTIPTIGKVFFTLMGQDYVCSATVIDSANRDTVVTAGHCVNNGPGEFAANWLFVPRYSDGIEPHGTWTARRLFAPQQWTENGDLDYDIGFAALNTNGGAHIANTVGTQRIVFQSARGQYVHSFGYPATSPYEGNRLFYCPASPMQDSHGGTGQGIACDMTEGSSGGPWFADFDTGSGAGTVISVNSFGYNDTPNVMWGPYLGEVAASLYQTAQSS